MYKKGKVQIKNEKFIYNQICFYANGKIHIHQFIMEEKADLPLKLFCKMCLHMHNHQGVLHKI